MIKTVKGVIQKLDAAKEKGYRYCRVAVDGNNIGCALIKDILDSINYCCTPKGVIKTFIHRGYEYSVEEGLEITILTNEEFMEHYMGIPSNSELCRTTEEDDSERKKLESLTHEDGESLTKEEADYVNGMLEARDALRNSLKARAVAELPPDEEPLEDDDEAEQEQPRREDAKVGFFAKIKNWLKGDVGYKR